MGVSIRFHVRIGHHSVRRGCRTHLHVAYLVYVFIYTAFVYPVFAHWTWGVGGWLHINADGDPTLGEYGVLDFAGGAPVHLLGGTMSLLAAWIIGPRTCRFTKIFDDTMIKEVTSSDQMLGMWLLWFGWFAFNTGSTGVITGGFYRIAQIVAANTLLCPCVAGLTSAGIAIIRTRGTFQIPDCVNGVLAGLVAITPACGYVEVWASFPIGILAGILTQLTAWAMFRLKIDDPCDAVAVHCIPGFWGVWATGFFAAKNQVAFIFGIDPNDLQTWGAFMGGGGKLFGLQVLSSVVCVAWG